MTRWIRKIHMYTGLLAFTALAVFGVAGVTATIGPQRPQSGPVETRSFQSIRSPEALPVASSSRCIARRELPEYRPSKSSTTVTAVAGGFAATRAAANGAIANNQQSPARIRGPVRVRPNYIAVVQEATISSVHHALPCQSPRPVI